MRGLTENLVSAHCLATKDCQHHWYSLVVIIGGIIYLTWFMYMKEIVKVSRAWLIPSCILKYFRYNIAGEFRMTKIHEYISQFVKSKFNVPQGHQMHYLTNDVFIE